MIKKFVKNLINRFNPKSKISNHSDLDNQNYILITCNSDQNYEPYIKLHIVDLSDRAREKFTETLYHLNVGEYHQSFINLMLEMSNQDEDIRKFMQSSMVYWGYLIKNFGLKHTDSSAVDSDRPLVSPMDFNKNAKQP